MPLLRLNNILLLSRWNPKWDTIILRVAKKYASSSGLIQWKIAEADNALKGIPIHFTRRDLSQRLYYLRKVKFNEEHKKKHNKYSREYFKTYESKSIENREEIFRNLPLKVKAQFGYKPRNNPQWTLHRIKVLKELAKKHKKTELTIDWDALMNDPKIHLLPKYPKAKLRSYYWSIMTRNRPDVREKRRADALRYKHENFDKYRRNQRKRIKLIRTVVNTHLSEKLKEVR